MGRSGGQLETSRQEAGVVERDGRSTAGGARRDRRRILDAMVDTVAVRGYADTDIDEVIERAGVSRPVFARLFSSKEECFVETISDAVRSLVRTVDAALPVRGELARAGAHSDCRRSSGRSSPTRRARGSRWSSPNCAGPAATRELRRAYERFVPYIDEGRSIVVVRRAGADGGRGGRRYRADRAAPGRRRRHPGSVERAAGSRVLRARALSRAPAGFGAVRRLSRPAASPASGLRRPAPRGPTGQLAYPGRRGARGRI